MRQKLLERSNRVILKNFKVVSIDLAGHGESGLERKSWTIEAFGGDVAAVVKKLGLKRVILIGHSMGGDVIAEAARQLPGQTVGLIMVDTYKKLRAGSNTGTSAVVCCKTER